VIYLKRAAECNIPLAVVIYGTSLLQGNFVEKDEEVSLYFFEKLSQQDVAISHFWLKGLELKNSF
jgi:hypothetical protein